MMCANDAGVRCRNDLPFKAVQLRSTGSEKSGYRRVKVEQLGFRPTVGGYRHWSIKCASTAEVNNETDKSAGEELKKEKMN